MKFKDTGSGIEFEPAPIGTHIGRCIRIIDLGTTWDDFWGKDKHEVFFMWELPHEIKEFQDKDGNTVREPFTVSKFYTMSLSDKAHLRHDLEAWRNKAFTEQELEGFDPSNIVGAACMINVIHTPKKKGKGVNCVVKSVTSMAKGLECPPASHDLMYFSLDREDYDPTKLEKLSKGIKARVMKSDEYKAIESGAPPPQQQTEAPLGDDKFDDIPF
jgi:hypothetical protein